MPPESTKRSPGLPHHLPQHSRVHVQVLQEGFLESNYALTFPKLIIYENGQLCTAGIVLQVQHTDLASPNTPRRMAGYFTRGF